MDTLPVVDQMLTTREVAALVQVSAETVRTWRKRGYGPQGHKIGRHVRYFSADVIAWIQAQE